MADKPDTVLAFMEKQKAEIAKQRDKLIEKQQEIAGELEALDKQLAAFRAFEDTLAGKPAIMASARKPRAASTGTRAPRGSQQEKLIALLGVKPMTRAEILDATSSKGDKKAEQSISNALTNMVKAKKLARSTDGKYSVAAS